MSAILKRVVEMAKPAPAPKLVEKEKRLVLVKAGIEHLNKLSKGLSDVEEGNRGVIEARVEKLSDEEEAIENYLESRKEIGLLAKKYKRLSIEPLKWRKSDGTPSLAVFALSSPEFTLIYCEEDFSVFAGEYNLPEQLKGCYRDIKSLMQREFKRRRLEEDDELKLECEFRGLIPGETKKKIKEAEDLFGDDMFIFIVAEATRWAWNKTKRLPETDPLVVGWHDAEPGKLWLIDMFDVTPIEQAMADFGVKAHLEVAK